MNKNLIVTIFVPQAGQEEEGKIGTGYPVAEDLILTSRHVIDGGSGEIRVRWHHYADKKTSGNDWIILSVNDIVWKGEGELDAVLLRCPRPEKARGQEWGRIANKKPPSGERWQSQGFPCATRYENIRNPDNVSGTTESMADQEYHFVLNVTSSPENSAMWKGASGMPVFVDNEILGVVGKAPRNFGARKLYAVPSWKMFEDAKFRELIRASQEDLLTKAIRNIEELLLEARYDRAFTKLFLLCKDEKSKKFHQCTMSILQQYDKLDENISNGSCMLSLYDLEKKEIHISLQLLLVEMKIFFNIRSACLIYEKEALRLEEQYNILRKRRIRLEDDLLTECDNPDNTERLKDILGCLRQTMEYLRQTIASFFILIQKFKAVKEYE